MGEGCTHEVGERCAECWAFAPGSDAELSWLLGGRQSAPERRGPVLPPPPRRVGGLLPGDLDVLAAQVDALAIVTRAVPSLLGCTDRVEGEPDEHGRIDAASPDVAP